MNTFERYLVGIDKAGDDWVVRGIPRPVGLDEWRDRGVRAAKIRKNLQFRLDALEWVKSVGKQGEQLIWQMCREHPLFFFNVFSWTFDPRHVDHPEIPFITWPFQDDSLQEMLDSIGRDDVVIEKSRDMGASWQLLDIFEYRWHFFGMQQFLLASRKEDLVDKPGVSDSLFWKIDFIHQHLPGWLLPNIDRTRLHIGNKDNGSNIDGESTTGDLARGGRRTAIGLDEFAAVDSADGYRVLASTQAVTNSRFFNSTPQGRANAYADMAHKEGIRKIRFHWSIHPEKSEGLYTSDRDSNRVYHLRIVDESYDFGEGYPFILDGKLRSPWYDRECLRTPIPSVIAQEIDIDYFGSGALYFDPDLVQLLLEQTVFEPYAVGEFDYVQESEERPKFVHRENGKVRMWLNPEPDGWLPILLRRERDFVIGVDVSAGTGSSSSTMSVVDKTTGEKVCELSENNMRPEQWGELAVAVARWFNDAVIIWEANGAGRSFGSAVMDTGYEQIWYRENESTVTRKVSDIPGWFSTKEVKKTLMSEYHTALARRKYLNRSEPALKQTLEYVHHQGGVEHSRALASNDPTARGDNHGDMVIADALSWRGIRDSVSVTSEPNPADPPFGSMAWRQSERRKEESKGNRW